MITDMVLISLEDLIYTYVTVTPNNLFMGFNGHKSVT